MSTGTKIALAAVTFGALFAALAGEVSGIAWALAAGFWIWQHDQATRRAKHAQEYADDLAWLLANDAQVIIHRYVPDGQHTQTGVIDNGDYFVDPEVREKYGPLLDKLNDPDAHYSVGGTKPHMCVCGIPLKEHR
jgi:hypothetical protein